MEEIWKDIPGYEGLYTVSNLGNIMGIRYGNRPLHSAIGTYGYKIVSLTNNRKPKMQFIHYLVMISFVGDREKGIDINHIDGNKKNNRLDNLEYCTRSENMLHNFRELGYKGGGTGIKGKYHNSSKKVAKLSEDMEIIEIFDSATIAAYSVGVTFGNLCNACRGNRPKCAGYRWKYL